MERRGQCGVKRPWKRLMTADQPGLPVMNRGGGGGG